MTFARNGRLLGAAALGTLAWSLAAGAALAATDEAASVDAVTVTAQLEAEDIQDVPSSVTAISGEKLSVIVSSGGDIRVLSARVPSLTLESSFGRTFPRPYIRGLGNTDFDLNASQPVSFVYDDVVLESPILKGYPLFDIAQVEVLRGPQGTLFGRNTPAGVLKFSSAAPTFDFEAKFQASYATFGTVNAEAAISGPLIADTLAGRLSVLYQGRSAWVDNAFTGFDDVSEDYSQVAVRGQLLFTPSEEASWLLNLHYMHLDGTPRVFRANIIQFGTNDFVPGFDRETISQNAQPRAFQTVELSGANLHFVYDFGDLTFTSITGFEHVETLSRGDIDGGTPGGPGFIPFQSESADGMPFHSQWSQEFRLTGDAGQVHFQAGAFYFREEVRIDSFNYDDFGVQNGYARQHQETTSWALFGTLTYNFSDQFSVTGGLRYSNDAKDFEAQRPQSAPFTPPLAPNVILTANPRSEDVSFNVSFLYELNDDTNFYGRIAKGYRAPSIQGRVMFGNALSVADTETVYSYEVGLKTYAFDRRLRFDADIFYYQVNDLQLTAVGGGANFNRLINADHANGYGFEIDLDAKPVDNMIITAGLSYNHTKIDDPTLAVAVCGAPFPLCTVLDPVASAPDATVYIDGNALPNAPRWIANVTFRYAWPMSSGELFVFTDWAYRSKVSFFLYDSVEFTDDSLVEGGLRIGFKSNNGWELAAFGRNITDDLSLEGGIDFNNLTGFVNDPRTIGVEFKIGW